MKYNCAHCFVFCKTCFCCSRSFVSVTSGGGKEFCGAFGILTSLRPVAARLIWGVVTLSQAK